MSSRCRELSLLHVISGVHFRVEAATGVLVTQMRQSCDGLQQHMAALLKYIQVVKASKRGGAVGGA